MEKLFHQARRGRRGMKALSLFSGIGGLDLAAEAAGITPDETLKE